MNFVDLFHPRELIYVLDILRHFNCQTLPDCSFISSYLDYSAGLTACLSVKHAVPCKHFHAIVNFLSGVRF